MLKRRVFKILLVAYIIFVKSRTTKIIQRKNEINGLTRNKIYKNVLATKFLKLILIYSYTFFKVKYRWPHAFTNLSIKRFLYNPRFTLWEAEPRCAEWYRTALWKKATEEPGNFRLVAEATKNHHFPRSSLFAFPYCPLTGGFILQANMSRSQVQATFYVFGNGGDYTARLPLPNCRVRPQ